MDAVRRANFASLQIRAGPAPLASFEDLPSDELESPEDFCQLPIHTTSALDEESSNQDLQFSTPDSLTISSQSTPRIECETDSHFTLTPADSCDGQSTAEMRTISLSSLSKEATPLSASQTKGSAQSLGNVDAPPLLKELNTRKSSWTDIFRSHNQNSAKSSSVSESGEEKHSRKKKSRDVNKNESKSKEKGNFLSFLKKKSNNKNAISTSTPGEHLTASENIAVPECVQGFSEEVLPKVTNGNISKGKENESPKDIELSLVVPEAQNDLGRVSSEENERIPDERKISRKLINITEKPVEKEYNKLSQQTEEVHKPTDNTQSTSEEVDRESSESEVTLEVKQDTITEEDETTETDFEAETLISQDMSELDEDSLIEIRPVFAETSKQILIPSRQQRLEVTTKPIDRPRSTTPINAAPLEAFIQSVSPTFVSKIDKIKLSLPGEQFVGRMKSPKKSSTRSWTDFCESVLHSPKMHKRIGSEDLVDPFASLSGESDSNWAAFDLEGSESNNFGDSFAVPLAKQDDQILKPSDPYQAFATDFAAATCSCLCHAYGCASCLETELKEVSSESCGCMCACHHQSEVLPNGDKRLSVEENFTSSDAANYFDSQ